MCLRAQVKCLDQLVECSPFIQLTKYSKVKKTNVVSYVIGYVAGMWHSVFFVGFPCHAGTKVLDLNYFTTRWYCDCFVPITVHRSVLWSSHEKFNSPLHGEKLPVSLNRQNSWLNGTECKQHFMYMYKLLYTLCASFIFAANKFCFGAL